MAKFYKVWIEIEEWDEKTDEGTSLDLPFASTAVFKTEKEAIDFATRLHEENCTDTCWP